MYTFAALLPEAVFLCQIQSGQHVYNLFTKQAEAIMANPVGRPRTTVNDLPDNWEAIMVDCGQEGGSAVEIRCLLGIGESAWNTLIEDSEEFRGTVKKAKALCEVWWERRGREMAKGSDGNATVWIFNMKNRFGWHDKQSIDHSSKDGSMTPHRPASELTDDELAKIARNKPK